LREGRERGKVEWEGRYFRSESRVGGKVREVGKVEREERKIGRNIYILSKYLGLKRLKSTRHLNVRQLWQLYTFERITSDIL